MRIVCVRVALNSTLFVSDWHFDNLCSSRHHSRALLIVYHQAAIRLLSMFVTVLLGTFAAYFSVSLLLGAVTLDLLPMETFGFRLGLGLSWVMIDSPLRLHAGKLPKGKVSVDQFWRETYL